MKTISTEHGELRLYRDWDKEGAIKMENARTLPLYRELKESWPDGDEFGFFFAITGEQLEKGYRHLVELGHIKDGDKICQSAGAMFGTREAIDRYYAFIDGNYKRIAEECDPQEVYIYEWNNHECMFSDYEEETVFKKISEMFGTERAANVKRFWR